MGTVQGPGNRLNGPRAAPDRPPAPLLSITWLPRCGPSNRGSCRCVFICPSQVWSFPPWDFLLPEPPLPSHFYSPSSLGLEESHNFCPSIHGCVARRQASSHCALSACGALRRTAALSVICDARPAALYGVCGVLRLPWLLLSHGHGRASVYSVITSQSCHQGRTLEWGSS